MTNLKRKLYAVFIIIIIAGLIFPSYNIPAYGEETPEQKLQKLEDEIAQLNKVQDDIQKGIDENTYIIDGYNAQASKLYGEIVIYQNDIKKLELEIEEIELNIEVINNKIEKTEKEIEDGEKVIGSLELETKQRIEDSYKTFRINGGTGTQADTKVVLNTSSVNAYFKDSQYINIIQQNTNKLLSDLATLQDQLEAKKKELEEKMLEVQKQKAQIETKKTDLEKQKSELDVKIAIYYQEIRSVQSAIDNANQTIAVFEEEEIQKRNAAEALRQEIFNSFNPPAAGEYVTAGRPIGNQGCTGLCTGPHLHFSVQFNGQWQDPCGYLKSGGPVGGCGWGNALDWPIRGTVYYTSSFGNRCFLFNGATRCDFHSGADFAGVPSNTVIYAAHEGYLYRGTDKFGANYVIICQNANCNEGIKTGYWHLQ